MAKTAVVNPRRRKSSKKRRRNNPSPRRRNYGAAASQANPRRRRRARSSSSSRRRNPAMASRRRNPSAFDLDSLMDTLPAATVGSLAARWATSMAGPLEDGKPGIKHAVAIWIAAHFGGQMVGQLFGSGAKGEFARIGALAFGGDLFARKHVLGDSEWAAKNLYLGDESSVYEVPDYSQGADLNGFEAHSQIGGLGDSFVDAMGNRYTQTAQGWALAGVGMGAQIVQGEDGQFYQLGDGGAGELVYPDDYDQVMEVSGFESQSPLGFAPAGPSHQSSFGYA